MRLGQVISDTRKANSEEINAQTEERIRRAHQKDRTEMERWTKSIAQDPYEARQSFRKSGEPDKNKLPPLSLAAAT